MIMSSQRPNAAGSAREASDRLEPRPTPAELESLIVWTPPSLLRQGPGRETFLWRTDSGLETVVKRTHGGPGREGWRERWRGKPALAPARREFELLRSMAESGLPVPRAIAYHRSARNPQRAVVVMERVVHEENLRQRLERRPEEAARWLGPLTEIVGGLHAGGWYHRDLYLDHLLVAGERLVLIDVGRARHEPRARRRWIVKDLAALWHSTPSGVSRAVALRFLVGWMEARGLRGRRERRRLLRAIVSKQRRMAAHEPRGGTSFPLASGGGS